ncbi:MAG TPA: acetylglutamate kinase [Saprospiraceae bacterium]|nr:acetylglutamate kinase [Saprospiraceae bacterium]
MEQLSIVKAGGNLLDQPSLRNQLLNAFAQCNEKKILVHGGGKRASELLKKLGIPVQYHEGRRITDDKTLDVVTMVYAGSLNKQLCAGLQARNCNALGMSGCDMNIIQAEKRAPKEIQYGWAGDIQSIETDSLKWLLDKNICPVINPITHDGKGQLLNTNADTIASSLAVSLSQQYKVKLHFCFEWDGVLENTNQPDSLIPVITPLFYEGLKRNKIITDGMIPKLDNAFKALSKGVSEVTIGHPQHFLPGSICTHIMNHSN